MATIAPPPPAPIGPPPLSDGRRRTVRVGLVVAATLVVLGVVAGLSTVAWGVSALRVNTDTSALPGDMKSLTIDGSEAPLAVRIKTDPTATAARADLRLLSAARDGDSRLTVTTDSAGTRVALDPMPGSFLDWRRGGEITVTLPTELARRLSVTTKQSDGVLIVDGDLDQLVARSTDGGVILRGAARRIDITVVDADIVAREPISVSESFVANSVDGDMTLAFSDVTPRTIEAVSRDGDITIVVPPTGPYLIDAQSSGSTTVRVPQTSDPARAVAKVTANADDGDVVVRTGR